MSERVMLVVDADRKGIAIIGGTSYRVEAKFGEVWQVDGHGTRYVSFTLTLRESLDEEAQRRRIAGLEAELARERERLDEIRSALAESES